MTKTLKIATPARKVPVARRAPSMARKWARQRAVAVALGAIVAAGMAVSLRHQAYGTMDMLGVEAVDGWLMAIVIDAGYLMSELAGCFCATPAQLRAFNRYAHKVQAGCAVASAAMNSFGFASHAGHDWLHLTVAIVGGCGLPAFLYLLTRAAAGLYTGAAR